MKYYIIAGERSGDLHGGNLIQALKSIDTNSDVRCWGGDKMQKAGGDLVFHYKEMAYMGFWEVLKNYGKISKKIQFCKKDLLDYKPDALILIDYAGFNMRIAKFAKENNIAVHYYISPKIWAWNQKRAFNIKRNVDHMYVILPFEKEFYKRFHFDVDYVGNPLLDAIRAFEPNPEFKYRNKEVIAVLPGSREQEVLHMLANLKEVTKKFPKEQFVIAGVNNLDSELYGNVENEANIDILFEQTYDLLSHAKAAIVTSGTATLETALFKVPQVVVYKAGKISFAIAKRVVKVKFISLVNLIMGKEVVKELIQEDFTVEKIANELQMILPQGEKFKKQKTEYEELRSILGSENTSQNTAELIIKNIQQDSL